MRFQILTIFPEFFQGPLSYGILGRARRAGLVAIEIHDLRNWTSDAHRTVDDRPFGGDAGMVMKLEPIAAAVADIATRAGSGSAWQVLLSAQGRLFDQTAAERLAGLKEVILVCGRYEGVDERVAQHLVDEELSVGNYVLSGGECAACVVVDAVVRLLPGVVGNQASTQHESFAPQQGGGLGILDCPQYTRPARFIPPQAVEESWNVPEVLLSGHHEEISRWRRRAAWEKTRVNRPDLLQQAGFAADGTEHSDASGE